MRPIYLLFAATIVISSGSAGALAAEGEKHAVINDDGVEKEGCIIGGPCNFDSLPPIPNNYHASVTDFYHSDPNALPHMRGPEDMPPKPKPFWPWFAGGSGLAIVIIAVVARRRR